MRTVPVALLLATLASPAVGQDLFDENVLRTFELTFRQSNYWQQLFANKAKKIYIKADLKVDGRTYKDVGVRFRGHSSWEGVKGKDKKPFKIAMDEFVPGQRLYGRRTLNLNNNFIDPTHMREPLAYWILRKFMPAPRCNFVQLKLNGKNWGLYIHPEQINKDFLRTHFENNDGNRYRAEWADGANNKNSAMQWLGSNHDPYKKAYELKTEPGTNPWVDLVNVIDKLNNSGSIQTELPKVLDVDTAIRLLVGTNLIPLHDSYTHITPHNYYLYNDLHHGRISVIPWDVNNSFGDYPWMSIRQKMLLDPMYAANRFDRPLLRKIVYDQWPWKQRFWAHFRAAVNDVYDWGTLGAKIAQYQKLIVPVLDKDPKRLYPMSTFWSSFARDTRVEIWVAGMKPFIEGRSRYLKGHPELRKQGAVFKWFTHWPPKPTVKDTIAFTAEIARPQDVARVGVYWRTRGEFRYAAMRDDGKNWDQKAGDGIYGVLLPKQPYGAKIEYYFEAEQKTAVGGAWSYGPRYGSYNARSFRVDWARRSGDIILSELLASNTRGKTDEKQEFEDWFEIRNTAGQKRDISGMFVTDDLDQPRKWQIPGGVELGPWGEVLVWADNEPADGKMHATFKLSSTGEELALFDKDGETLLDHLVFGPQLADVSIGRAENWNTHWVSYPFPTPGQPNLPPNCGVRVYTAFNPSRHTIALLTTTIPKVGGYMPIHIANAPPNGSVVMMLAAAPGNVPIPGLGVSLLFRSPVLGSFVVRADANGVKTVPLFVPQDGRFAGLRFSFQGVAYGAGGFWSSNGLELHICR